MRPSRRFKRLKKQRRLFCGCLRAGLKMIEINLLPVELRKRESFRLKLPAGSIKNLLVALGGVFILVHIGILVMFIAGGFVLKSYNKAWANVQPEKRQLDEFKESVTLTKQYEELF